MKIQGTPEIKGKLCGSDGREPRRIPSGTTFPRTVLLLLCASFVCWSVLMCATSKKPSASLQYWNSDHYSHTAATALFLTAGLEIYRQPVRSLCQPRTPELDTRSRHYVERDQVKLEDVCWPAGQTAESPLYINWSEFPRPYPPGQLLLFVPEAAASRVFNLGFAATNLLTVVKLLFFAHLAWFVAYLLLRGQEPRILRWLLLAVTYAEFVRWSLIAFYDGVALLGVLLSLYALRRNRGAEAVFWASAAIFLHFRALWYLPVLLYAFWVGRSNAEFAFSPAPPGGALPGWRGRRNTTGALLAASAAMLLAAAVVLFMVWPALGSFPLTSRIHVSKFSLFEPAASGFLALTVLAVVVLGLNRRYHSLVLVAWCAFVIVQIRQIQLWHPWTLIPLLYVPAVTAAEEGPAGEIAVLLFWIMGTYQLAFNSSLWPTWLGSVLQRLA